MPLDHQRTAMQIAADTKVIEQMLPLKTLGETRTWANIKDSMLGLADWHEDQHKRQQKALNLHRAHTPNKGLFKGRNHNQVATQTN